MRFSYLNNAATSYPKPEAVTAAIVSALESPPSEPGRTGDGEDLLMACRRSLASLLGVSDPRRIVLLPSATHGLNLAISGLMTAPGAHVVTTELEHNSVLRPIAHRVEALGGAVSFVSPDEDGQVSAAAIEAELLEETCLVVVTHASNLTGCVQPVEAIAELCAARGLPLVIDAAQSAGCVPIDHASLPGRVFLVFAGHKGLLGPCGTGGLVVPDDDLPQQIVGGTGVRSESPLHPAELPLRYEAGTPNLPGIAGLLAGVGVVSERGVEAEGEHRQRLVSSLRRLLGAIDGVALSPLSRGDGRAGIASFTLAGWSPEDLGFVLRKMFNIETRYGLHCAPRAHRALGTSPEGSIRVSVGPSNTEEDISRLVRALREVRV